MIYLLKLGKASLHRYPVGQKFCRNTTSKFLFYEDKWFQKVLYHTVKEIKQFCVLLVKKIVNA